MKENIAGKYIKIAQVFIIIINIISLTVLLIYTPLIVALLADTVFLMLLLINLRLYSVSIQDDCFIFENLFNRKIINKKECIGLKTISNFPLVMSLRFKNNKKYRFHIGYFTSDKILLNMPDKSTEDIIINKIQVFLEK